MMDPEKAGADSKLKLDNKALRFSDRPSFNFPLALCWIAAVFSVLGTLFLWWTNNDAKSALKEKEAQKNSIVSEIVSPTYVDVEKKATGFKSAVSALSAAAKDRYSMDTFLKAFYTKVTKDTTVTSLSVTQDGSLNVTGQTKSYRGVAEQMIAFSSWNVLKNVDLTSVSMATGDQSAAGATFSIGAKIDKTVDLTGADTSDTQTSVSSSISSPETQSSSISSGGTSEAVQ